MDLPASLAWTPDRATQPSIIRAYNGELIGGADLYHILQFPTVGHAAAWADSTDMTSRVTFSNSTPVRDLTSRVTVLLDHRI